MTQLVIVSNRLPFQLVDQSGSSQPCMSTGGLVTALRRVLDTHRGVWIGWPGVSESDAAIAAIKGVRHNSFRFEPVFLSAEERDRFYLGFSNEIIWPLFHDLQSRCNFDPEYWDAYRKVNARFAESVAEHAPRGSTVWVHDYHLFDVGQNLGGSRPDLRLGYFHHIPFPQLSIFQKLPWGREVMQALMAYDLIGFQTPTDRRNFIGCLRHAAPEAAVRKAERHYTIHWRERKAVVGNFPISIDFEEFAEVAESDQLVRATEEIRRKFGDCRIVLGVDRLDYTKGIPERLRGFRVLLAEHPEVRGKLCLVQVTVPSREDIPKYRQLRSEIEQLVSSINGQFTQPGWVPIHYFHRSLTREELIAFYSAADIALVTPLKDGMNLVAKEYCAAKVRNDGVLVLSEFAGAATELRHSALLVNPYDFRGIATTLLSACTMSPEERRDRMRRMRRVLKRNDVFRWAGDFLSVLGQGPPRMSTVVRETGWAKSSAVANF